MTRRILEREIARNSRDIEQISSEIAFDAATAHQTGLTFRNIELSISVSATLEERSLDDQLTIGHPDAAKGIGRGEIGDQTGDWSQIATADSIEFVSEGKRAFVDALAGETAGGAEFAVLGDDGTAAAADDTSLGNQTTQVDGWGKADGDNTSVGYGVFGFAGVPSTIKEFGIKGGDGQLFVRGTVPDESRDSDKEYRLKVTMDISITRTGTAAVTSLGDIREAIRSEDGNDLTTYSMKLGTDNTAATQSDTDLGTSKIEKDAVSTSTGNQLELWTYVYKSEPSTQPHDFTELGAFASDGTMLWRLTYAAETKDADRRLRPRTGLEVR